MTRHTLIVARSGFDIGHCRPPGSAADWRAWLVSAAAAYRLLCPGRDPAAVDLWIDDAGHATAAVRNERQWQSMSSLALPGGRMLRLALGAAPGRDLPLPAPQDLATGRYRRLASALGAATLARWRQSVFAVAGTGNAGLLVAHTLVRSGASVVLLDPDRLQDHNLGGNVLPQHEDLYKTNAVVRILRPVLRLGTFADARLLVTEGPDPLDSDQSLISANLPLTSRVSKALGSQVSTPIPSAKCSCSGSFGSVMALT